MIDITSPRRPRWFQFSLRALLMLMLVAGVFFAGYSLAVRRTERPASTARDPSNIQRGDRLTMMLSYAGFAEPRHWTVEVLADGCIRLPELGQVPAAGLSLDELTKDLNERYSAHHYSGQIQVNVFVFFENTFVEHRIKP